jgi:hypothetical protein
MYCSIKKPSLQCDESDNSSLSIFCVGYCYGIQGCVAKTLSIVT